MNILNIEQIHKIFGDKIIFDHVSQGVEEGDKIGIVGINGTGKTTLLRILAGEEDPDEGQIVYKSGLKLAWLPQNPVFDPESTVLSYAAKDGEKWKVQSFLNRLGITDQDILMKNLSGGQQRRAALAKVLASDFDILLLDEPTNPSGSGDAGMVGKLFEKL